MSFIKIINEYRQKAFSERDKGDRFERLMQAYLLTDPQYANQFKYVWLWEEFPGRKDLGGSDLGIDLVAMTHDSDYWAIQCKCYAEDAVIDKKSVDSFLTTSSRKFKNDQLQTVGFSHRLWISTTNKWSGKAEESIRNQNIPFSRLNLSKLEHAPVDWEKLNDGITGDLARTSKKSLRPHQKDALNNTHNHFQNNDRGKLIMACGTGKTYTSLKIAENETNGSGLVLFLVPSIALLGQTLREWSSDAENPIKPICICSDSRITKIKTTNNDTTLTSVIDLAMPASTDVDNILRQFQKAQSNKVEGMTVVFSTYQSIEVIAAAQSKIISETGKGVFDLIICDEAHRTTGVTLADSNESAFVKVHDNDFIQANKRLYMTATPRLYSDESKSKAAQTDAVLCSMDDIDVYGEEIYRIGFGEAVERDLLADYKVLVLTLSEKDVPQSVQKMIANEDNEINSDDASKLIGCLNALSKQVLGDEGLIKDSDPDPMKKAVAFCQNIKVSKKITNVYNSTSDIYLDSVEPSQREKLVSVATKHIDGSMSAPERDELLSWLKSTSADSNECRILNNVRCLSEGVDVPSLDAVLFLSARNSQVDVVQSVGRVMRKAPGKKYGYIIIPVVVPSDIEPSEALKDNERFKVVWSVLNALRAHDDRFNATINKIDLNKKKPNQISVVGVPGQHAGDDFLKMGKEEANKQFNQQLAMQFEQLQSVVYAKMVQKVGDRVYWERWAKDVAVIAQNQKARLQQLVTTNTKHTKAFDNFLGGLQKNINTSITSEEAIDMLSQHIITKPVFEALFDGYSFAKFNPISTAMQSMLDLLEDQAFEKETEALNRFYDSVKKRATGIDNAEGRQRIIIELYDKFFKTAFPKMVEQLGIVYTPIEVVDFIVRSVDDVLKKEFGRCISDENIHILDPFTGTGTFITRLLQSGLIKEKDLERKYKHELHANEIVLLAYYIAAINIENAYHDATPDPDDGIGKDNYTPFDGIVLTDTFQLGENPISQKLFSKMFPQNSKRVQAQQKSPIRVIIGNPPYSAGQKSANDNASNLVYPNLDNEISKTYQSENSGTGKRALYDAYIKAFRWSTDRLDKKRGGIISYVTNGNWIEGSAMTGFRKTIENEFDSIYVFNLRGNARTQGELRRKEAGNVFKEGSRTPISITLLINNPENKREKAEIHYHDIGDYLSRDEKLSIIKGFGSLSNTEMKWQKINPNEYGDWINQRNDSFYSYINIGDKKQEVVKTYFNNVYTYGVQTNRDSWVWNFNLEYLKANISKTLDFYNEQRINYIEAKKINAKLKVSDFINYDSKKITWDSRKLKGGIEKNHVKSFNDNDIRIGFYRPFCKQFIYFNKELCHSLFLQPNYFPKTTTQNKIISISGAGMKKGFSVIISSAVEDLQFQSNGLHFPLYYFEKNEQKQNTLFDSDSEEDYIKRDGISDFILNRATKLYGKSITKEDIFYYVYGILHSKEYRETFANDLKKMLPRIPLVERPKDFWAFSKAGRKLAELHINYESVPAHPDVLVNGEESEFYTVEKMRFPKKEQKNIITYNSRITLSNIPEKAYQYVVNGKPAIEWIMERYQVTTDKKSGIKNDPNDWSAEVGNPRYILDLLLSVINVSTQTVYIVNDLPKLDFEKL